MKIQVDSTKCDAYGLCAETAPDLFELDDFGYATARGDGLVGEEHRAAVQEAITACPVAAIRVLEA
ncbi:ferredoxin [Geodermatophilus sp. CPCC 206100]|uniref:ferredoxin n=1 Tax=Geodermatophilus sp. CPCC 206100 TaxID=3020054 RepID=UPI003B002EF5